MSLLRKASIVTTPTAYENGKILSVKPNTSVGDFDFTRSSSATRVNSQGLIEDITSNLPRIDYTGGEGHWLFEPQSTNLIPYSEDLTNWAVNGNITVTSNATISPEGVNNAVKLQNITTSSSNQCVGFTVPSLSGVSVVGKTYSASIYIKPVNASDVGKFIELSIQRANGDFEALNVNVEITSADWKRYVITYTFTGAGSGNQTGATFKILKSSTTIDDIYVFGVQFEESSFATSYIPTNGSTITRLADAAFGAGSSDLINSTEGVLYAEIAAFTQRPNFRRDIALSDGTRADNIVRIHYLNGVDNTIRVQVRSGGTITASASTTVTDIRDFHKIAISYKVNEIKFYLDGVLIITDTNAAVPIGLNQLSFSDGDGTQNRLFGKTKCVAVFKEALTDAELTCLTTI